MPPPHSEIEVKVVLIANNSVGEMAVSEPNCTYTGVTEVGRLSSSSPPSPSPDLKRIGYPFIFG